MIHSPPFANPLLPAPSQDPWVTCHEEIFYAVNTDGRKIFLRQSEDLRELFRQPAATVWQAPARGPNAQHLWAPELHRLDGRWLIYYAADNGQNRNHRLWALEAAGVDAAGPYRDAGMIDTGGWSIDGTVFGGDGGERYLLWSGWEARSKVRRTSTSRR